MTVQNTTGTPSRARQTGQDSPQEPEALLGWLGSWGFLWAWHDIRGPHRVPQQPLPPPRQGGRRLEWPQQEEPPAPDESPWTRPTWWLKCSCGHNKTNTRHSWPWHVDYIHGARDSGGQRAWVSANPVGLSQRRSGGLESAAIRRALSQRQSGGLWVSGDPAGFKSEAGRQAWSQRRAGGHWVSGDPVAWSPVNGAPGGAATREPAGGLGRATAGGRYILRSAGMRASRPLDSRHSRRSRRTPTPSCSGLRQEDEWRLPCHGTDKQEQNKNFSKNEQNKTRWRGAAYG